MDVLGQLVLVVLEELLDGVGLLLRGVAGLGVLAALLVLLGVGLGLLDHAVDVLLGQGGATGDGHGLLLAGAAVLGRDVHDAVGVDVEGDLNLGHAAGGRGDAGQLEGAQRLVVPGELALALVDLDEHGGLVVLGGGEDLGALGRDGRVALDELGHDPALGLNAQGQRRDVDEQDVTAVTLDDAGLEGRADGDDLVGVDALVGLLAGQLAHHLGDGGHTGGSAHEDHVVDVGDLDPGVLDDVVEGDLGALEQVRGHLLEVGAGELLIEVDGAGLAHGEVLQVDVRGGRRGELLLGLLGGVLESLHGDLVLGQVHAVLALDLLDQPVDDAGVPVVTAQAVVTVGGAHLDGGEAVVVLADLEQGDVEGTATEVEDEDELVLLALVQAVGQGRGGGLVDDAVHGQARNGAGLLGGLTLGVVEVGRDGDDRVGDGLTQVGLGVGLELGQDAGADLLGGVLLVVDLDGPVGAHVALDRGDGAVDVGDRLALGDLADEDLAGLGEGDDGGGGAAALGVRDDGGLATLEDGDSRVGGTQVDTDSACHVVCSLWLLG